MLHIEILKGEWAGGIYKIILAPLSFSLLEMQIDSFIPSLCCAALWLVFCFFSGSCNFHSVHPISETPLPWNLVKSRGLSP